MEWARSYKSYRAEMMAVGGAITGDDIAEPCATGEASLEEWRPRLLPAPDPALSGSVSTELSEQQRFFRTCQEAAWLIAENPQSYTARRDAAREEIVRTLYGYGVPYDAL